MQSYSQDLRDRVLWALDRGERPTAIARRLEVSHVWVYQVRGREQKTGTRTSFQIGGHRRSRVAEMEPVLRAWIEQEPGLSLAELCERLVEQGVSIKIGALWHQLNKWNLTFKKTLHASEQEREDAQRARRAWRQALPTMEVEKLVFIDETWTSTSMTRRYGRAPRGKRCIDSAPQVVISESATCQVATPAVRRVRAQSSLRPQGGMNMFRRCVAFILRPRRAGS